MRGRRYIFMVLLILTGLSGQKIVNGQDINLHASFSRDTIMIGDQVDFTFRVNQPQHLQLNIPVFTDTLTKGIEILKHLGVDTVKENERLDITHRYLVTSFDTTSVHVPPLQVSYSKDSVRFVLASPPVTLVVQPAKIDTSRTISDIKMPYKAPVTLAELLPYLLGLILLAGIVWGIYYYFIRRKRPGAMTGFKQKPLEPAHVIALRELTKLKEEKLWQQGEIKGYYTRLTDILREYLENRYGIAAMEMTTMDILYAVKAVGLKDQKLNRRLKDMLNTADLVKFAKLKPQHEKNEKMMVDTVDFVNETKKVPVVEVQDNVSEDGGKPVSGTEGERGEEKKKEEHQDD